MPRSVAVGPQCWFGPGCLVELIVALVTYRVSCLPRTQGPSGSRRGPGASQEGMNVFLGYPAGRIREVVHDSTLVTLYVARLAWAPTLHTSQAWIELGFFYIVAIYGTTSVHWDSMLLDVLGRQFRHLEGSSIQKGWRGSAM